MKIGIKIPLDVFSENKTEDTKKLLEVFGGLDGFLKFCSENLYGAELAQVKYNTDSVLLEYAVKLLENYGLCVTVHGALTSGISAKKFFAPYNKLINSGLNNLLNITVHPLGTPLETEAVLTEIVDFIEHSGYNIRITLENQRNKNEHTAFAGCEGVKNIVKRINSPHLFLCFDFGHQLSNIKKEMYPEDVFDNEFLSMVRHIHIHSYCEGSTHFPLDCGECELDENITGLLKQNYDQMYLLELLPGRYADKFSVKESYANSIAIIKTAIRQAEIKLDVIKKYQNIAPEIKNISDVINCEKCKMGVIGHSAYVLKLGSTKLAIDPCVKPFPYSEEAKKEIVNLLNTCDAVIVTHDHGDHFDRNLIEMLSENIPVYIPDFINYDRKNNIKVSPGDEIAFKDVVLKFFESAHSRGENVVPEYGFSVEFEGKNYVFPSDVREYKTLQKVFENTEAVIVHLWLGRNNALKLYNDVCNDEFADFVKRFNAKKVYISHLYDAHRKIGDMWTEMHYDVIKDRIKDSRIIRMGDLIDL